MSLITAYFKKGPVSVDALLPEISRDNGNTDKVKCPESVHHSVDLLQDDEDSKLSPPKKMKIALFAARESPTGSPSDCTRNQEAEQSDMSQDVDMKAAITRTNTEDDGLCEQTATQMPKQQSRQTTLKFENGKCILIPMESSTGMETGSQESSQVDSTTEEEYLPKKKQTKKKKSRCKYSNEEVCSDNFVEEVEPPVTKKRSRKVAKEAAKQLIQGTVSPQSCMLTKLTTEDDQAKLVPEIVVVDSENVEEIQTALDNTSNDCDMEGVSIESSPAVVVVVAKEIVADDSSDSDVICLTPRSASPLSQESTGQPRSRPATPAKNKWSHIFGTKSPQKKSSPSRKSSPRKSSPRKSNPIKQVAMTMLSSLTTSHEHYTLGAPLFHHVIQQDHSLLWDLPKVELSSINAHLTTSLSHCQPHVHTTGAAQDHLLSKRLINLDKTVQRSPLTLKFVTSEEKKDLLNQLNVKHASSLCCHFTLLNQQLSKERSRLMAEWASWEEQVRLVQAENEKLEKEVVEVPEDPPLELVISIRYLRTDIASESVTVDTSWYNKQQKNSHTTYNLRCRRQRQSWKEANSDSDGDDGCHKKPLKRRLKKRKKRLSTDDEDSSWSDEECEKKETMKFAPKKAEVVLTKPLPGLPTFKPLNDSWVDMYAPRQPDHILGNQAAIQVICQWLADWKEGHSGNYSNSKLQRRREEQSDYIILEDDQDESKEEDASTVLLVRGSVGCGKTSAIYACANQLGYKVFELNSSSRRSGSQVISVLQEATQSHQITAQRRVTKQATSSQDEDAECKTNNTQDDVKPSRTITSFFKLIGGGADKDGNKMGVDQSSSSKGSVENNHFKLTLASHTVILIEEVDVLFEDDKGFWSAVYDVIASSKRPIICTCNDPCLVLECHHNVVDMVTPSVREISDHLQIIALSHDLYVPAETACTLTAMLQCDTRRVIHTLHYALCHANAAHKIANTESIVPARHPASVLEQILMEAKSVLFSDLFLTNLVNHLNTVNNCAKFLNSRLQRPWCNRGSILRTSQSKHSYVQLDTLSSACDWLSQHDIIGNSENSSVLNPYNAHHWWDVTEQSSLSDAMHQLSGELEEDKLRRQQDEIASYVEHLTEQFFSVTNSDFVGEELVLQTREKCRKREEFNSDMLTVIQSEFTNQLLHSAMATDFLPYMHVMCKSEEARKVRQRRFRHYLSARGVSDTTISSLLHHQKLLA